MRTREWANGLLVQGRSLFTLPIGVVPALVMLSSGREHRRKVVVPFQHQFDVTKTHVGAIPVRAIVGAAFPALRRTRGRKCVRCLEMSLANQCGLVAGVGQGASKTPLTHVVGKFDAVVRDTVGTRQEPGQDRGA